MTKQFKTKWMRKHFWLMQENREVGEMKCGVMCWMYEGCLIYKVCQLVEQRRNQLKSIQKSHLLQFSAEQVPVGSLPVRRSKHWDLRSPGWRVGWFWSGCCPPGSEWMSRSWVAGACATGRLKAPSLPRSAPPSHQRQHLRCSGCCRSSTERRNRNGGFCYVHKDLSKAFK